MQSYKIILFIIYCLTLDPHAFSQNIPELDAMFCGKKGESGPSGGAYTLEELQNCDFKIIPLDTSFTVTEFRLTLVEKGKKIIEKKINGNKIPHSFREQILIPTKKAIYLELIKAESAQGQEVKIKPIAVRINETNP